MSENTPITPPGAGEQTPGIEPITIEEEMKTSYRDYELSVIVFRRGRWKAHDA